jgi:hypothetical protein
MPGLVLGIHAFVSAVRKDVDGRDKPGHDEIWPRKNRNPVCDHQALIRLAQGLMPKKDFVAVKAALVCPVNVPAS